MNIPDSEHVSNFIIQEHEDAGLRVDVFLSEKLNLLSRSQLKARISVLRINGKDAKLSKKIEIGDKIELAYTDPVPISAEPQEIPLTIIFENQDVLVINKPSGLVVHPAPGSREGTLVNGLLFRYRNFSDSFENESVRPGIVHRLDKDTSGVLIVAKNPSSHEFLSRQFRGKKTEKSYLAVAKNTPNPFQGIISSNIRRDPNHRKRFIHTRTGGKSALTNYKTLMSNKGFSFLILKPKTGRTHQLRVHLKSIGCPILGDPVYSRKNNTYPEARLMLHAYTLKIFLPGIHEKQTFRAPLPADMKAVIADLGK